MVASSQPRLCRFCSTPLEHSFLDLGKAPLSNAFLTEDDADRMEPFYPLHVFVCAECFLVQLAEYESPQEIFSDYAYFSSYSDSWLEHCSRYARKMVQELQLGPDSLVVEVASNDGYLLQYFKEQGVPVLGIEPAANIAARAEESGIPTEVLFLGEQTACELNDRECLADLVVANNVLAHVPDLNDFVAGLRLLLKPDGIITLEFPHLMQLMANNQFDTIYHEHFSYLSLLTCERVFAAHQLTVYDVEEIPTHGGSLRLYARHSVGDGEDLSERGAELKRREVEAGLNSLDAIPSFQERVREARYQLLEFLITARRQGKQVAGYGAPAKGNTLLNYCGVRTDLLSYTVDRSPYKQGRYLPGTHIPIYAPNKIGETRPDYLLILPWNLRQEVMQQMGHVREWGCRFVLPIPELQVLS